MRTRPVGPAGWKIYVRKAEEFKRSMDDASSREDWNAVGLAAVHTVISAADAISSFHLRERSASKDHGDCVELVRGLPIDKAERKSEQASQVLDAKNLVEYEDRDFGKQEAIALQKKAYRFFEWVRENLP